MGALPQDLEFRNVLMNILESQVLVHRYVTCYIEGGTRSMRLRKVLCCRRVSTTHTENFRTMPSFITHY
jgi:hypothetical protein